MKKALAALAAVVAIGLAGCNPGAEGVGDPYTDSESSGTGGEGAGPTGTSGGEPADNPASQTPGPEGTGTDAPN
jgi:hypothetical protein